jgi:small-conductance mechanosensitive channel
MDIVSALGVDSDLVQFIKLDGMLTALVIIAITWVLIRLISRSLDTRGDRITERRLLLKQVSLLTRFTLLLVASLLAASSVFDFSGQALYGVAGLLFLGLGYAFKDVLSSVTAGVIILFDRPFQVGDRIAFGGHYGEVREIGIRKVQLVDLDDNVVSIPNSRFLSDTVSSANFGALHQMCVFSFYIGCNEDFERARKLISEATVASRYVYLDLPVVVHFSEGPVPDGAERFALKLTVKAYVFDGRYESAFGTDVHERVKRAFRAAGIRTAGEIEWGPRVPPEAPSDGEEAGVQ